MIIDHFDLLAPLYDRVIGPPDPTQIAQLLDLSRPGRVLDAGGGTGRVAAQLRPLVGELVVLDASLPMLRQAQRKGLAPLCSDVRRLPFADESFDGVVVVDALHHFPDAPTVIGELLRVLRPGGRLVIEEPDLQYAPVKLVALAERLALMGSHFLRPAAIQAIIGGQGVPASVTTDGHFAAWVVAEKAGLSSH